MAGLNWLIFIFLELILGNNIDSGSRKIDVRAIFNLYVLNILVKNLLIYFWKLWEKGLVNFKGMQG